MQHVTKRRSLCSLCECKFPFSSGHQRHNLLLAVGRVLTFYLVQEIKLLLIHQNLETSIAVFQSHYLNVRQCKKFLMKPGILCQLDVSFNAKYRYLYTLTVGAYNFVSRGKCSTTNILWPSSTKIHVVYHTQLESHLFFFFVGFIFYISSLILTVTPQHLLLLKHTDV